MNISNEFFPARTEHGKQNLLSTLKNLDATNPDFYSVTFGALGSATDATYDTISLLSSLTPNSIAPHLTCIGSTKVETKKLLQQYIRLGVERIVVLRGDVPPAIRDIGEFHYASELVEFIKKHFGNQFIIDVAAYPEKHPQSKTVTSDIQYFANKVKSGADSAITQYFYNIDAYFRFIEEAQQLGVNATIVPGIMPITNFEQLARFSKICNADIPTWILNRLEMYKDDAASLKAFGTEVVSEMCSKMKSRGVNDFHFFTMNRSEPTLSILDNVA